LLAVNILGGSAVIGSYILELAAHPGAVEPLWGGVPAGIRPYYSTGMILAAAGYFAFTYFLLFRIDPNKIRIFDGGAGIFPLIYLGILVPSALWMPATYWAIEMQSVLLVWAVRIILILVGLFSLGLLAALLGTQPREPAWAHTLAVIGSICFCIQTVVLDAIVWGMAFQV
jgi:hypothetical protein